MIRIYREDTGETLDRDSLQALLTAQVAAEATYTCPVRIMSEETLPSATDTGTSLVVHEGQVLTTSEINGILPPRVDSFFPVLAPTDAVSGLDGERGLINGEGMLTLVKLLIDGTPVPFTVESDTRVRFTIPVHAEADVNATLVGQSGATTTVAIRYRDFPVAFAVSPSSGPVGTAVTIVGENLQNTTGAYLVAVIGGLGFQTTDYVIVSDTEATVTIGGAYSPGADVRIGLQDLDGALLMPPDAPVFAVTA